MQGKQHETFGIPKQNKQKDYPTRYTIVSREPMKHGMTTGTMHLPTTYTIVHSYLPSYGGTTTMCPTPSPIEPTPVDRSCAPLPPPTCGTQYERVIMKFWQAVKRTTTLVKHEPFSGQCVQNVFAVRMTLRRTCRHQLCFAEASTTADLIW